MAESGDEVKLERKKNGSVKKKKKVVDGPPPKASDVAGSKKIRVFKNGDIHHHGVKFVVNTRTTSTMQALLDAVNQRIELPYGAKKLYSISGKAVKSIDDLENGKDYIAASNVFTPLPYGETKPGEIRWETPGSSFKATPTGSASTITRSRSTEPIAKSANFLALTDYLANMTEKKKTIRAKSQAPNKLAAPATETTKSDTDIPLVKKKKIVKKSSIAKPASGTNGINGVNGTSKKLVKKETNGEKKMEKKSEKPEKLNNGIASPEKKKVLKKKAAAAAHKDPPRTGTRSGKRVEIKERRESEVSHKAPRSPARSEHSRHSRSASSRRSDTDGESDRDTDRSYNQSRPNNTTSSSGSSSRSSSSSSSSRSSDSSNASRRTLRHGHEEHHKEHEGHHHEKKDHHHDDKKEHHHHEHEKHHGYSDDKKDEKHHDSRGGHHDHEKKHHDGFHNNHEEHHGKEHHHQRERSHSSSSGGSIKSHVSIITRGLPTAHEKRGSYTIERKRTPNGTVHVIHHHSSRHGSPESSRPATSRTDKKRDDHERDEESDNASDSDFFIEAVKFVSEVRVMANVSAPRLSSALGYWQNRANLLNNSGKVITRMSTEMKMNGMAVIELKVVGRCSYLKYLKLQSMKGQELFLNNLPSDIILQVFFSADKNLNAAMRSISRHWNQTIRCKISTFHWKPDFVGTYFSIYFLNKYLRFFRLADWRQFSQPTNLTDHCNLGNSFWNNESLSLCTMQIFQKTYRIEKVHLHGSICLDKNKPEILELLRSGSIDRLTLLPDIVDWHKDIVILNYGFFIEAAKFVSDVKVMSNVSEPLLSSTLEYWQKRANLLNNSGKVTARVSTEKKMNGETVIDLIVSLVT
ncbi:rpi-1 [Pristionchus pacificus]|uniref:Doublecortin domain-containing protein n=1 Tax=Pristionchus pacificus TaxID=54126 RepID=A0A2A6B9L7_PRIPA|nr:rpi-1 [Pristionchus pacificus]|eukprot:PDM62551.1 hypothetical protein PRIPAC_51993 [Pristionchus pacificus]